MYENFILKIKTGIYSLISIIIYNSFHLDDGEKYRYVFDFREILVPLPSQVPSRGRFRHHQKVLASARAGNRGQRLSY